MALYYINRKSYDAESHFFIRLFLFYERNTPMLQIATFLAIGPQIHVDGMVVVTDNDKGQRTSPEGRIRSKRIVYLLHLIDQVKSNTAISKAAELLMNIYNPCLISEGNKREALIPLHSDSLECYENVEVRNSRFAD